MDIRVKNVTLDHARLYILALRKTGWAAVAWAARLADDEADETEMAAMQLAASPSPDAVSWPTTFPDHVIALRAAMAQAVAALRAELDVDDGALDA